MDFIQVADTGLKIATRQQIYESLCEFARAAYGNDISLDEGTPFNSFLQMMADNLSTVNGSVQSFSELFSTKELSGNFLDFVAGQRGVVRKVKKNQRVIMAVTVNDKVDRPFIAARNSVFVTDSKGRTWVNTSQLQIQAFKLDITGEPSSLVGANYQGTCEFGLMPLDGYDTDLLYSNNDNSFTPFTVDPKSDPIFTENFTFINKINATPAVLETETDAQLRSRYDSAVYSSAVATIDGLRSNLLKYVDYVRIIENFTSNDVKTDENPYGLTGHSIWCIVGGGSTNQSYGVPVITTNVDSGEEFDAMGLPVGSAFQIGGDSVSILGVVRGINTYWKRDSESTVVEIVDKGVPSDDDYMPAAEIALDDTVSNDPSDIAIAQTILNYKSLGCGVSVPSTTEYKVVGGNVVIDGVKLNTGDFMVEIPVETIIAQIPFTRLVENNVNFSITLSANTSDGVLRDTIRNSVSLALQQYVSTLQPGVVITTVDVVNAIYGVLSQYDNGLFDFVSMSVSYAIGKGIEIYQRAVGGMAVVDFA